MLGLRNTNYYAEIKMELHCTNNNTWLSAFIPSECAVSAVSAHKHNVHTDTWNNTAFPPY